MFQRLTDVSELEDTEEIQSGSIPLPIVEDTNTQNSVNPPITGVEVIPHLTPGTRVQRGPDWKWGDQVCIL